VHTGKVKKLISGRGFGFISDTDGREVFFHQDSLIDAKFGDLSMDQAVEFEVEDAEKGPRAVNVRIAPQA